MYDLKKVYEAPTMGLQDRLSVLMCDPKEAPVLENWEVNKRGILDKVKGYSKDCSPFPDSTDSFIRMLLNLKRGTTVDVLIMAAQDNGNTNANYKVDFKKTNGDTNYEYIGHTAGTNASFTSGNTAVTGSGTSWLSHLKAGDKIKATAHADSAYTEISSVNSDTSITLVAGGYLGATLATTAYTARIILNKSYVPRGIVFNNKAVITNGSEHPMTYDNTTLNLIADTDCPHTKYIEAHKSRVFMAHTQANPSRVYWSAVNDSETWDAASYEDVFPQDNGNICSIRSFNDSLVVFKDNGNIYQIFGDFDKTAIGEADFIRKIDATDNIGTIIERTPVVHNNFLYFIAQTGVYRLDSRGVVEKMSWNIDNFISGITTALGASSSKAHVFDTKTQWDNGTHSGTYVNTSGTLTHIFDKYTRSYVSDYWTAIDGSSNLHLVWKNTTVGGVYHDVLALGASDFGTATTITASTTVTPNNLAASSGGKVAFATNRLGVITIYEYSGGVWSTQSLPAGEYGLGVVMQYSGESLTAAYYGQATSGTGVSSNYLKFATKVSGSWVVTNVATYGDGYFNSRGHLRLRVDGSGNPKIVHGHASSLSPYFLVAYSSADGGVSFSRIDTVAQPFGGTSLNYSFELDLNNSGQMLTGYCVSQVSGSTDGFKIRNHSSTSTTTIDATVYKLYGYLSLTASSYNTGYYETATGNYEKYLFESSSYLTNSSSGIISSTSFQNKEGLSKNGVVVLSVAPGANANEIVLRRLAYRSSYTSDIKSDSTLTSWDTYVVSNQIDNSATVAHTIAVNTSSPPTVFNTITNGAIISTDSSKHFVQFKIDSVLGAFSAPSIDSITLNYYGAGVDARSAVGVSFNNQLYYSVTANSGLNNNKTLIFDLADVWTRTTYPISAFERYRKKLYAGLATKGDLLIIQDGYNFDGSAYTADFQSKEDFLGSIDLEKDIGKFYILYEVKSAGTATFSYRLDNYKTSGGSAWSDTTLDLTRYGYQEILVGRKARTIQFRVQDSALDGQAAIIAVVLTYRNLNQR